MRTSRFTEEQIVMALRQAEAGTPVAEICRKLQIAEATFYRWKEKFSSLGVPHVASKVMDCFLLTFSTLLERNIKLMVRTDVSGTSRLQAGRWLDTWRY